MVLLQHVGSVRKGRHDQVIHLICQPGGEFILFRFVESRLVEITHIQPAYQNGFKSQPHQNLQCPVDHGSGIENAVTNVGAKANILPLRMKA